MLNEDTLTKLMVATFSIFNSGSLDEFGAYAEGVVQGLKLGTVTIQTTGAAGSPGQGTGIGAIQGGAITMAPIVALNSLGIIPPIPEGAPQPLQILWYLAIAQIATHALVSLQVDSLPMDAVAVGVGIVPPGGIQVQAQVITNFILLAYLKRGLKITPRRIDVAQIVGKSTQQMLLLATMIIPIAGGVPAVPGAPAVGVRTGTIS
jgi:hypothetical protein